MIIVWERKCSFFEHFRPQTVILVVKIAISAPQPRQARVTRPKQAIMARPSPPANAT
jgi:hypothetical protein